MTPNHEPWRPELLAGYVDGELGPAERASVEAWLAAHPEGRAELNAQRELSRHNVVFWKKLALPAPGEAAWARIGVRLHDAVQPPYPAVYYRDPEPMRPKRAAWQRWAMGLAATAALVLAAWSLTLAPGLGTNDTTVSQADDSYPVAKADDVDVITLQGDDNLLVVGQPPLTGAIDIITVGDVVFEAIRSDTDPAWYKPNGVTTDPKKPFVLPPVEKGTPVPVP